MQRQGAVASLSLHTALLVRNLSKVSAHTPRHLPTQGWLMKLLLLGVASAGRQGAVDVSALSAIHAVQQMQGGVHGAITSCNAALVLPGETGTHMQPVPPVPLLICCHTKTSPDKSIMTQGLEHEGGRINMRAGGTSACDSQHPLMNRL